MAQEAGTPVSSWMSLTWSGHGLGRGCLACQSGCWLSLLPRAGWAHSSHQLLLTRKGTAYGGREGDEVQLHTARGEMRQGGQKGTGVRVPPGVGVHTLIPSLSCWGRSPGEGKAPPLLIHPLAHGARLLPGHLLPGRQQGDKSCREMASWEPL